MKVILTLPEVKTIIAAKLGLTGINFDLEIGGKIVSDASNNIEWKQGEITEVEDPMPEWDEIKDQVNTEKT